MGAAKEVSTDAACIICIRAGEYFLLKKEHSTEGFFLFLWKRCFLPFLRLTLVRVVDEN